MRPGLLFGGAAVLLLMVPGLRAYAAERAAGLCDRACPLASAWAIGTLILKRRKVIVPATVLTGWQLLITAVPTAIGALWLGDGQWFMPSWQTIVVVAYIALIPMSVGNVAWFSIVGMLPVNVAGLSSIMVPMVAMVSGALGARRAARPDAMGGDALLRRVTFAGAAEARGFQIARAWARCGTSGLAAFKPAAKERRRSRQ